MDATVLEGRGLSLRAALERHRFVGSSDIRVRSVAHDWRRCREGDLFVSLSDLAGDSHDRAARAVERGAAAVLTEAVLPLAVPQCIVPDTREAYARLCMALAGRPDRDLITIGITGTAGKTTTSLLLASILQTAGEAPSLLHDSELHWPAEFSRPVMQPGIAAHLRHLVETGQGPAIIEANSRALAQRQLAGVELDVALITNVRRDHLDLHHSTINYRRAKGRLLEQLKDDGLVIVNADDRYTCRLADESVFPVLRYGVHQPADLTATVIERDVAGQTFLLDAGEETHPVSVPVIGEWFVSDCLAAAAVAMALGIELTTIVRGLERARHLPRRLERIECGQPFSVYVDTASTPETLASALKAVAEVSRGQVWCLFGPPPDRDPAQRPWLGRVAKQYADRAIVTRCEQDTTPPGCPFDEAHDVLDGYHRLAAGHVLPTRTAAMEWVLSEAAAGDSVLIAGSADPLVYPETGESDVEYVRELLYRQAGSVSASPAVYRFCSSSPN